MQLKSSDEMSQISKYEIIRIDELLVGIGAINHFDCLENVNEIETLTLSFSASIHVKRNKQKICLFS